MLILSHYQSRLRTSSFVLGFDSIVPPDDTGDLTLSNVEGKRFGKPFRVLEARFVRIVLLR